MKPTSNLSLIISLAFSFFLHRHLVASAAVPVSAHVGGDLIQKVCSETQNKDFCVSTLNSVTGSNGADLKGLAFIALKVASKRATETAVKVKLMLNDTEVTADDDALITCDKEYVDVVDQIEDAVNALVSEAYPDVKNWVEAAEADLETCEDTLPRQLPAGSQAAEISKSNEDLRKLFDVSLSITDALAPHGG